MIPIALTSPSSASPSQRQAQRVSLCLPAELVSLQGQRTGLVVNMCTQGARVEIAVPPEPGSEVLLYCGGIEAEGEVVWRGGQHCGIRFHTPIADAEIDSEVRWSRIALLDLMTR